MSLHRRNIVLIARVIDAMTQEDLGEYKTVQQVECDEHDTPQQAVEYALEICDAVEDWKRIG